MRVISFVMNSGDIVELGRLTLIVGPNGVGKSTFMAELFDRLAGRIPATEYWVKSLQFAEDNPVATASTLIAGLVKCFDKGNPLNVWYQPARLQPGENANEVRLASGTQSSLDQIRDGKIASVDAGGLITGDASLRRALTAYHSCETRLSISYEVEKSLPHSPPSDIGNVLYRRNQLLNSLSKDLRDMFGVNLQLLLHTGLTVQLGIAEEVAPASLHANALTNPAGWYDDTEVWKRDHFIRIDRSGHGIQAALNLLSSVSDPLRQLILIDEPELFLFPQAKRLLGRSLVDIAQSNRQVVVVTHDGAIVQGILDASADARLIRLDFGNSRKERVAKVASFPNLPMKLVGYNQAGYLDTLFAPSVLLVEGPTDRMFYQYVMSEFLPDQASKVAIVGASAGKAEAVKLARLCADCGVRNRVILDFDALFDPTEALEPILKLRAPGFDLAPLSLIVERAISELSGSNGGSRDVAKKLLKNAGVLTCGLLEATTKSLETALETLGANGVYVVPGGELESWCRDVSGKSKFVEAALEAFRSDQSRAAPVISFLRDAAAEITI
jgi:predicted ATPase